MSKRCDFAKEKHHCCRAVFFVKSQATYA